jgi:hypothetical protein
MPTRHPDMGYVTKAGYIQKIPVTAKHIAAFILVFHGIQTTVRIVLNHDMVYSKWYPFDATVSPLYELANLSQVLLKINHYLSTSKSTYITDRYSSSIASKFM